MAKQKERKVEVLFKQLKEGVENVYSSETWKELLLFQSKMHDYSFNNMMLIYIQCPHATHVAGYDTWRKLGRQVMYGQTGIRIMAPHTYTVKDEKTGEEEKRTGYHQTSVFDISQTKGKDIPVITELKGDSKSLREFYEIAKSISRVPVSEEKVKGAVKGYYSVDGDYIVIKKGMATKQKCKTLIHEMAHSILHRKEDGRRDEMSRNEREIEAEGTAFVVLSYFGFDTSEYSFPYVAGWNPGGETQAIQKAGDVIQKTSQKLIDEINAKRKNEKEEEEVA
ncbi:ImmA/IrrE family metallo-endopeptidase [Paenibacillus alvei]|uniref:ArdC-like ssDNA-binding domain-containing protein n=1 Tax=Paenibacillus alvei TaxID=44250 RepID=UPI00028A060E|nr:ArdC-like ssDNA-binding domain-containing protein [Paenibacillus alvei]EJW13777.1 hypothetical protein PAV_109p00070 [Paenibacillus alvei DSM 29]MCY9540508.1 ImmA/IrrE family metallo-endopeptidase [Paenibacillus alvei]MCY9708288.1 ImmA/IrrE family metallo-endopeptidase [Paenibacillus alvei]MCY9732917.1 ImmA/IrrE family metallo-endopeptidase [Paenibacillus alvei]MCY9755209.1 ImmA/IrrE family metallo-endopeptidase [Paenibacillus alvei]